MQNIPPVVYARFVPSMLGSSNYRITNGEEISATFDLAVYQVSHKSQQHLDIIHMLTMTLEVNHRPRYPLSRQSQI